jgi:multimeric flavodoxin WrbA
MQEINTVVTFSSRTGVTERLGLAAGLGAVQAHSLIRLRWLSEKIDDQTIAGVAEWKENRARMTKEYIAPREIDFLWADVLVLALPARDGTSSPELKTYLDGLKPLQSAGKLQGKVATAFTAASNGALISLCSVFEGLDLILIPPDLEESATLLGRRVTQAARDLRGTSRAAQP